MFKIEIHSLNWLQTKFSMSLFFTYLLLRSICGNGNSSQQTSLQCLSTINMVFSDEDEILIVFILEVHSKEIDRRLRWISSKSCGTPSVDIATICNHRTTASFHSHPHLTKENNYNHKNNYSYDVGRVVLRSRRFLNMASSINSQKRSNDSTLCSTVVTADNQSLWSEHVQSSQTRLDEHHS